MADFTKKEAGERHDSSKDQENAGERKSLKDRAKTRIESLSQNKKRLFQSSGIITLAAVALALQPGNPTGRTEFELGGKKTREQKADLSVNGYSKRKEGKSYGTFSHNRQIGFGYTRNAEELAYEINVEKNPQTACFVNGLAGKYWYQLGLGDDWPYENNKEDKRFMEGFSILIFGFHKNDRLFAPHAVIPSEYIKRGDKILMSMRFTDEIFDPKKPLKFTVRNGTSSKTTEVKIPEINSAAEAMMEENGVGKEKIKSIEATLYNPNTDMRIVINFPYFRDKEFLGVGNEYGQFTGLMTETLSDREDYGNALNTVRYRDMTNRKASGLLFVTGTNRISLGSEKYRVAEVNIASKELRGNKLSKYYYIKLPIFDLPIAYYNGEEFITDFIPK
jgi:hypothetical protein